ncbi:MAG: FAD:protein FMN transferase [Candidatus Hydrogenedens sp.]|nr:FAD:protein FMN transferase [Candidatus Hydrogenedentota bacterium]NLF56303.1 FAD:protein FMN transferase [Candidatus Hydrogenedens sp.]
MRSFPPVHPVHPVHRRFCLILLPLLLALSAAARADSPTALRMTHRAMGTEFEFVLLGDSPDTDIELLRAAGQTAFEAIDALEQRISNWIPESPVSVMNRLASIEPVTVDHDVFELLRLARRFYEETDGAFDVTVGPLLELWGFYGKKGETPTAETLAKAREKVGFNHVLMDLDTRQVRFEKPGMHVDFGGIGKGLALDRAAEILKQQGVNRFRIHGGTSTFVVCGAPPTGENWTVDIYPPYNICGGVSAVAEIALSEESLSTSAAAANEVEVSGRKRGHIFDPRTGMPVDNGVLAATAVAPTGAESDALSTAFFVMGLEKTREYCGKHPSVRAVLSSEKDGAPVTAHINFP